jgi:ribosomal protein S18 acetylase RimI-like enzyme
VDAAYRLVMSPPPLADYLHLRRAAGLTPATEDQAVAGLHGAWAACHAVLGDGGWYFHVIDMAVLPEHQRRGIGDAVLTALVGAVRDRAPAGAWVNLLADAPGRRLYERHGFTETAPESLGMAMRLG